MELDMQIIDTKQGNYAIILPALYSRLSSSHCNVEDCSAEYFDVMNIDDDGILSNTTSSDDCSLNDPAVK